MTELEQAAMAYGIAVSAADSAHLCRAPEAVQIACADDCREALVNLQDAAMAFFNNVYDGAPDE